MNYPSSRFSDAVALAIRAHDGQVRKGTIIPYISHPLAVAALVLEYGGTEEQVIAGALHDVIEDGTEEHSAEIGTHFGPIVFELVQACTDGTAKDKAAVASTLNAKKADWERRKHAYLARLESVSMAALLVSACDKLHNARSIVADIRSQGPSVFERFTGGREGTLWYYEEIEALLRRRDSVVAPALTRAVWRMKISA